MRRLAWKSNFSFLADRWPLLANLGEAAERNLHHDANTTLFKLRLFAEKTAEYILAFEKLPEPEDGTQFARLQLMKRHDILSDELLSIFHALRKKGNKATHEGYDSKKDAATLLSLAYRLGVWFMQTYGDWDFKPAPFVQPPSFDAKTVEKIKKELEKAYQSQLNQLQDELERLRKQTESQKELHMRRARSMKAAAQMELTEEETRKLIDQQLERAGWEADSQRLRFSLGARPEKGRNLAIAEWPVKGGVADYALFVGLQLVALVEAKRQGKDVVSHVRQAAKYAENLVKKAGEEWVGQWGKYRVPFVFATNGRPYIQQWKEKSGIWFHDLRQPTNHPKPLRFWFSPQDLIDKLKTEEKAAEEKLRAEPMDYLDLRDYQKRAIRAVEEGLAKGKDRLLVSMATGTGKTRTAIGLIYRLIKTGRFRRILFLVDRRALGEQAEHAFKETRLEGIHTFTEIYELLGLDEKHPTPHTKVHIATVQSMIKRIFFGEEKDPIPTAGQYDCIIVDEAHRGYTLDREMSETEYQFRDQRDYISKYRAVLDHFDAVKIGLTATPALHTTEIFGKPIFNYSYREAVIDGHLVDHELPIQFHTRLKEEGIHWNKGDKVQIYEPKTGKIEITEMEDEVHLEVDQFNRKVVTESFNRVILGELANHIDPMGEEKTLIFAVSDDHADMVVNILKEELEKVHGPIDDQAVMKITGSIHDPLGAIRLYKNERYPNIAVTVDLLTTGIDVPRICNLVFLRRVRSRILYEQMLGRATRPCLEIGKTHFRIFDAVSLYEALEPVSTMKPVIANPNISFTQLARELLSLEGKEEQQRALEQILGKLQRKRRRMNQEEMEQFRMLSGGKTVTEYIHWLRQTPPAELKKELAGQQSLFLFLDENHYQPSRKWISEHPDEFLGYTRGYGKAKKPEDYLEEFGRFIRENMNRIAALRIVCERPSELTRQALKELKFELDRRGFTESGLRSAWREMTNQDIAADIIAFIRQQALGDALISREERVKRAMERIYRMKNWTPVQRKWLEKIERHLLQEAVLDPDARKAFEVQPFKRDGGYRRLNHIFEGKIQDVLNRINHWLYTNEKEKEQA